MFPKIKSGARLRLHTSPWIIIGSAAILFLVVVVLAWQNYNREKEYMSGILSEKGAAIIMAVEAGVRTGIMRMMWGGDQVQTLIEETALLPGVLYISVIDRRGRVLADSRTEFIGTEMHDNPFESVNGPGKQVEWRFQELDNRQRSFEVYRCFSPASRGEGQRMMHHAPGQMMHRGPMMTRRGEEGAFSFAGEQGQQLILVGLDPAPFEEGRKEDVRNSIVISGVLIILGLAGFVSMFWMQSYRLARRSLQDTSAIAEQVVTSLPVGLMATDRDGNLAFYNNAAERITGLDLGAARGMPPETVLPGHLCGVKEYLARGEPVSEMEMECEFAGGRVVPVSVSASNIINEEGDFVGEVMIIRDLGELRRLQDEIRRNEKLAALGELAAGVAHELRNPLSSIKGIASYYKSTFEEGSEEKKMAGVMIEEVDRLSRVISELLEFARPASLNRKAANIDELVAHSTRLVWQEAAAKNIEIQLDLNTGGIEARVDPDRLTQCLLNLYLNAFQAMKDGGRLSIVSTVRDIDSVVIDIRDNGAGIPAEDQSKIFDPYFTTKPKGTGLGLPIVHKIIEAHQGQVKVRSAVGQGTVFSIILPLAAEE